MTFYIFKQNTLTKKTPLAIDNVPDLICPSDWIKGEKMDPPIQNDETLQLDLSPSSGQFKSGIIDGLLTLYHYRLYDALIEFGINNIQSFPVNLLNKQSDETIVNYRLVNIIGLLDCLDFDKSKTKDWPSGRGFDFLSMVIDENKVNNLAIFRLKDDPTKVIINEDLKHYLESKKLTTGIKFIATEDYSDW